MDEDDGDDNDENDDGNDNTQRRMTRMLFYYHESGHHQCPGPLPKQILTPRIRDSSSCVTEKHTIQRLTNYPTANTLSNG